MNKREEKEYLDRWGSSCFICGAHTERKDMILVRSIVPLEKYPDHAESEVIHYYMCCPSCKDKGELV